MGMNRIPKNKQYLLYRLVALLFVTAAVALILTVVLVVNTIVKHNEKKQEIVQTVAEAELGAKAGEATTDYEQAGDTDSAQSRQDSSYYKSFFSSLLDNLKKKGEEVFSIEPSASILPSLVVSDFEFERESANAIRVHFNDDLDNKVSEYVLERRGAGSGSDWKTLDSFSSDGEVNGNIYEYTDEIGTEEPTQFEYRVTTVSVDEEKYLSSEKSILASNVMICLDPGHFEGRNEVTGDDSYGYCEGDYTLKIGLELRDLLRENYGIDVLMTRETGTITIGGHTNGDLDNGNISLRGEMAKDCTCFISLHTNSNADNANGYDTFQQPISLNKALVIMNIPARGSDYYVNMGNLIVKNLTDTNYSLGLSDNKKYDTCTAGNVPELSGTYNDGLGYNGTVCGRYGKSGDYYGVLRGAATVNKPAMIIEHGYHSIPEVRKAAKENDLYKDWAKADAEAIAEGFGFK